MRSEKEVKEWEEKYYRALSEVRNRTPSDTERNLAGHIKNDLEKYDDYDPEDMILLEALHNKGLGITERDKELIQNGGVIDVYVEGKLSALRWVLGNKWDNIPEEKIDDEKV